MKTRYFLLIGASFLLMNACGSSSSDPAPVTPPVVTDPNAKVTYDGQIKALLVANCSPCHVSGGQSNFKYDVYSTAKNKINDILDRVQRESNAEGFMPKGGAKISTANIDLLKKWQADGLLEK